MLLLGLTCLRATGSGSDVIQAVMRGDILDALRIGLARLERDVTTDLNDRAVLGQVLGQALLAVGREEQAEELFQKQLRVYEGLSRAHVRWLASLDRGHLFLSLNKQGRAAEVFNIVADDTEAPMLLRVEALAGLAKALHGVGEHRRATRTLQYAAQLIGTSTEGTSSQLLNSLRLVEALRLEMMVGRSLRHFDDNNSMASRDPAAAAIEQANTNNLPMQIMASLRELENFPIAAHRMSFLLALVDPQVGGSEGAAPLIESLRWIRDHRLDHVEEIGRIEAALALVNHGNCRLALELLGSMAADEVRMHHHRYALELKYCVSKLHAMQGRYVDALRFYKEHAAQAISRLRSELLRVPYSRFLEKQEKADQTDAEELQLPLRYRKAYQFIIAHLDEKTLSIRRVAAQIDVTERALQMAFRTHLGMTPAELIRRRRMERIRTELQNGSSHEGVLAVASRWGMRNRSTLAQNYRQQFGETPTTTSGSADTTFDTLPEYEQSLVGDLL